MYAHVVEVNVANGKMDEGIQAFRDQVLPSLHNHSLYRGSHLLVDREESKAVWIGRFLGGCLEATQYREDRIASLAQYVPGVVAHRTYEVALEDEAPAAD